jgi:SSS family solute:Na+ symporter
MTLGAASLTPLTVIAVYLGVLMALGALSARFFRGTSADYFVASRSIGPFLLLMSIFGTTMTGFAMVGSTGKTFEQGIGVYGLMASSSGLVHSLVFFLVGMRLWAIGKRCGYVTQVQFFRDRFQSELIGYLLFPILVALIIPYLLVGIISACRTITPVTLNMFPEVFEASKGAIPPWLSGLVVCGVVLFYVLFGGVRSAAWANAFQTVVFMATGVIAFILIARAMGGMSAATAIVAEHAPQRLAREGMIGKAEFMSYMLVPLSVGMFPHLFQHWLTARTARTFRLTVVAHPIFIGIVWVPCVLVGMWAAGLSASGELTVPNANAALGRMVAALVHSDLLSGLLTAGILAAIMSSLDSQFICLGTMFTNDVVVRLVGRDRFTDRQLLWLARGFVVAVVALSYGLSMAMLNVNVFDLGVWCFSGFAGLFPVVFAALYWRRVTGAGAIASVLVTAAVWVVLFVRDINRPGHVAGEEGLILGVMPVAFIVAAGAVTLVLVSLLTRPPQDVRRFFP